jgi:hypothetical protein
MAVSSLEKLPELKIVSHDKDYVQASYGDLKIDILLTNNPLFKIVQQEYTTTVHLLDRDIPIATVEGLLLLKFYALPSLYRQGNFARVSLDENDIATLLYYYRPDAKSLINLLSKYVSESDLAEIRTIGEELQNRAKRFNNEPHE